MTDLDPCLLGCDSALAEAEMLIAILDRGPRSLDPEVAAVRLRIARLRREVERLRGMATAPPSKEIPPNWTGLASFASPWCAQGGSLIGPEQIGGV